MKEDYLWNKTGNDTEIEKLENALKAFRYRETAAPAIIPAKVFKIEKKSSRRFFSLSFAFASCIAFVLILLGVWFQFSDKNIEIGNNPAETITPEIKIALPEKSPESVAPVKKDRILQAKEKQVFAKEKRSASAKKIFPQKAKFVKQAEKPQKTETVKLTEEELYAYDQLRLALSITSSKLNLVREKVALNENPNILIRKE